MTKPRWVVRICHVHIRHHKLVSGIGALVLVVILLAKSQKGLAGITAATLLDKVVDVCLELVRDRLGDRLFFGSSD